MTAEKKEGKGKKPAFKRVSCYLSLPPIARKQDI
jgi:hypothetical protein